MKKIIVEIDGQRHRLIKDGDAFGCERCSLIYECRQPICRSFGNFNHFEKEE